MRDTGLVLDIESFKRARQRAGYSQKALALAIGRHHTTVNKIETNRSKPSALLLWQLCNQLGIDLNNVVVRPDREVAA